MTIGVVVGRRVAGIVAVIAVVTGLAACGADPATEPDGAQTLTKEQYVERANAVCVQLGVESEKLADAMLGDLDRQPTEEELEAFSKEAAALRRQTLRDLRALPAPEGDEDELAAIYAELERVLEELEAIPPATPGQPGDVSIDRFRERANDYGLTECAGG